ncbi:hypothetical protein EKO04_003752 [Ascochyta lentis]|uniref:N-acetyltransferase domain-containing protein n=1 Tax=Ascochyta lentis TaxID=205686 RepID=A0A8H7J848_9PLEO|nr:hypothetical protein EKO04_003752 [Ascochyta lentis]
MQTTKQALLRRNWTRESYLISTDASLVPISELNAALATDLVYWANPLPEEVMREMLENSLCFGLYDIKPVTAQTNSSIKTKETISEQKRKLIGFARCVTDFSTFSYLTDVYVLPSYQGEGLGKWLVGCVGEVHDAMPFLRRSMLFTGDWERSVPFYERVLGMGLFKGNGEKDGGGPAMMHKQGPGFVRTL